jgi:hypothetical protein
VCRFVAPFDKAGLSKDPGAGGGGGDSSSEISRLRGQRFSENQEPVIQGRANMPDYFLGIGTSGKLAAVNGAVNHWGHEFGAGEPEPVAQMPYGWAFPRAAEHCAYQGTANRIGESLEDAVGPESEVLIDAAGVGHVNLGNCKRLDRLNDQVFPRPPTTVKGCLVDPGTSGDTLDCQAAEAPLDQFDHCRFEDPLPNLRRPAARPNSGGVVHEAQTNTTVVALAAEAGPITLRYSQACVKTARCPDAALFPSWSTRTSNRRWHGCLTHSDLSNAGEQDPPRSTRLRHRSDRGNRGADWPRVVGHTR